MELLTRSIFVETSFSLFRDFGHSQPLRRYLVRLFSRFRAQLGASPLPLSTFSAFSGTAKRFAVTSFGFFRGFGHSQTLRWYLFLLFPRFRAQPSASPLPRSAFFTFSGTAKRFAGTSFYFFRVFGHSQALRWYLVRLFSRFRAQPNASLVPLSTFSAFSGTAKRFAGTSFGFFRVFEHSQALRRYLFLLFPRFRAQPNASPLPLSTFSAFPGTAKRFAVTSFYFFRVSGHSQALRCYLVRLFSRFRAQPSASLVPLSAFFTFSGTAKRFVVTSFGFFHVFGHSQPLRCYLVRLFSRFRAQPNASPLPLSTFSAFSGTARRFAVTSFGFFHVFGHSQAPRCYLVRLFSRFRAQPNTSLVPRSARTNFLVQMKRVILCRSILKVFSVNDIDI
ncbi:hypothetical protein MUB24_17440 [Lederbergia sp. NSJ-179]|uniref:hypothetical protein n=1 Tax=Lederbergia sp. NSJ-179 TaxID=2931402 RepID=UPI001FD04CC8|nr:hypothetical protein [Lederbergia sp. NSJ-179]MCJ7842650.1 hypothetical protein [Lederbergia sp. NSJ-179]